MANICHIAFPSSLSAFYVSEFFNLTHIFKDDSKGLNLHRLGFLKCAGYIDADWCETGAVNPTDQTE